MPSRAAEYETATNLAENPSLSKSMESESCIETLSPWLNMSRYEQGVSLGRVLRRRVVKM